MLIRPLLHKNLQYYLSVYDIVVIIIIIIIIKILYLGEYSPLRTFVPPQDKICCPQQAGLNWI
jgi:hypothetical protein